jgi:hypothetical protein
MIIANHRNRAGGTDPDYPPDPNHRVWFTAFSFQPVEVARVIYRDGAFDILVPRLLNQSWTRSYNPTRQVGRIKW